LTVNFVLVDRQFPHLAFMNATPGAARSVHIREPEVPPLVDVRRT
jgi:hypothetical protein